MAPCSGTVQRVLENCREFDRNKKYIHKNFVIATNNSSFENAIVELQSGDECALNVNEYLSCKPLRTSGIECEFPQTDDFAGDIYAKKKKTTKYIKYIPCSSILPTSNHLERFFSTAGFASNDDQKSTMSKNLEEQFSKLV